MVLSRGVMSALLLVTLSAAGLAQAGAGLPQGLSPEASAALLRAYPDFLDRIEGNDLVWKDGTRMRIDGGKGTVGTRPFEAMLDDPDIKDMFAFDYPLGDKGLAPDVNFDPGRARYLPLFRKMYGDCRAAGFTKTLADVVWLPGKDGRHLRFSRINGAAGALQRFRTSSPGCRTASLCICGQARGPTIAARLPEPIAPARTASASRSTSRPHILIIGYGQSRAPAAISLIETRFPGRSSASSRRTASSGAASGITTTRCISNIGLSLSRW